MEASCCHDAAASNLGSPFLQILSLGLVWVFLHCAPMCGPIVTGLNLNRDMHPIFAVGLYQLGRGIMYSIFGGLAGALGSTFFSSTYWGWILVGILAVLLMYQIVPAWFEGSMKTSSFLLKLSTLGARLKGWSRPFAFGILFAFLPCMLTAWALTLAASTNSWIQGASLMLLLVGMSTLPLLGVSWGASKIFKGRQKQVSLILLGVSFVWTILVTAAAQGLIPHFHFGFSVGQETYKLMFW